MSGSQETRVTKISRLNEGLRVSSEGCLVMIHGPDLGKKYALAQDSFTIGRDSKNELVLDLDNVSRRHALITTREGQSFVQDLDSTNGTYLNDAEVVSEQPLRSGDYLKVGGAIFKFLQGGNIETLYHEEIYQLTIMDGLTQINNKRYFLEYLEREMGRCHRYGRALSLIMFDIDHFKKINDTHGHLAGDHVLKELARLVQARIRRDEVFARYGGEEFAVLLPETTLEGATQLAHDVRQRVEDARFVFQNETIPVTVSIGLARLRESHKTGLDLIKEADERLYDAKRGGRNRVVVAAP